MLSLKKLLLENENLPALRGDVDLEGFKQELARCLDLDPSEIQVGVVPAKSQDANDPMSVIMDYTDLKKTGDIWANFNLDKDTDEIADMLNGFRLLDNIEVKGCSGQDLSGIVSDGNNLAGRLVITSKVSEAEIVPFMRSLGAMDGNGMSESFEHYWNSIGGKVIGEKTVQRVQQQLAGSMSRMIDRRAMNRIGQMSRSRQLGLR